MDTTTIPSPVVMDFKLDTRKQFEEVRHYYLVNGKSLFTQQLNISKNRGFSRANYTYSLRVRNHGKWSKQITGLYPLSNPNLFYGDTKAKKNLILIQFKNEGKELTLYFFWNFYPKDIESFIKIFQESFEN